MNEQTETPRTDDQSVRYYDDATGRRIEYVASRFARQLERELTAARAEVATIKEQRDRLAEALNKIQRAGLTAVDIFDELDRIDEIVDKALQSLTTNEQ